MPWTYHQKSGAWHDPQGTLMHYGYSGHGDNAARNRTASEGCIILPRLIREAVAANVDRGLLVVE